jgi:putative tricarboxylic transport membrane protein
MYGGAIPAILLRIPGTPAAIATTFDGYPMAKKGEAGKAIEISSYPPPPEGRSVPWRCSSWPAFVAHRPSVRAAGDVWVGIFGILSLHSSWATTRSRA